MTDTVYQIGQRVRLTASFYNENSALADPTLVTYTITLPDGTTYTKNSGDAEVTSGATGIWVMDYTITMNGVHVVNVTGTVLVAALTSYFLVGPIEYPRGYHAHV